MKKNLTLDNQAMTEWQKAFKLSYDWKEKSPSVIPATLALSTLVNLTPGGYYLAKQEMSVADFPPLNRALILQGEILRKSKAKVDYIVCRSAVGCGSKTIINLSSILIKPENHLPEKIPKPDTYCFEDAVYWHTFTPGEVHAFSVLSGDANNLHTGEHPVVQGMLMLLLLEDYLARGNRFFGSINVHYRSPVLVNEPVKIYSQNNMLSGLVHEQVCFTLNFQEEKNVTENKT